MNRAGNAGIEGPDDPFSDPGHLPGVVNSGQIPANLFGHCQLIDRRWRHHISRSDPAEAIQLIAMQQQSARRFESRNTGPCASRQR